MTNTNIEPLTKDWLVKRTYICVSLVFALSVFSYYFLDRQIVLYLSMHNSRSWPWAIDSREYAIILSKTATTSTIFAYLYFGLCLLFRGNLKPIEQKFLTGFIVFSIAYNSICTNNLRAFLGRAWPSNWAKANVSFLSNHIYGFHLGINNLQYTSFPSGHAAISAIISTFTWYYFPRWRFWVLSYALFVVFIMVIQYYHFLSDVIVGAGLGYLTMIYVHFFRSRT